MDVVVVFPCVPATASVVLRARNSRWIRSASDTNGMRSLNTRSSSTLPREIAFPTTTKPGTGSRLPASYGCTTATPISANCVDIGGYEAASDPLTSYPLARSNPASDAIAVPQIPIQYTAFIRLPTPASRVPHPKHHTPAAPGP